MRLIEWIGPTTEKLKSNGNCAILFFMRNSNFEFDEAFRGNSVAASPQETEGSAWTKAARVAVAGVVGFTVGAIVDGLFGTNNKELVGTSSMLMELFFGADAKSNPHSPAGTTKPPRSSLSRKGPAVR